MDYGTMPAAPPARVHASLSTIDAIFLVSQRRRIIPERSVLLLFRRKTVEESALSFSILLSVQAEIQSG
jgi:hypothetical protein